MSATAPPRRPDARPGRPAREPEPRLRLVAPSRRPGGAPVLDASQQAVLDHPGGPLLVLAGPGTGKTTTVVELVADRVHRGLDPRHILVLTFSTAAAAELRARIGARLGVTTPEPLARTFHSYAYGLLRRRSAAGGGPVRRLLPASEVQVVVAEVLEGLLEGQGRTRVDWPAGLVRAAGTRGFAAEVTDVLARAAERGLGPGDLHRLARTGGRPEWAALARFADEYDEVLDARFPDATDQAGLVRAAVAALGTDAAALAAESTARRLVVVDEFQDCDPGQLALLEAVAGGGRDLVVVGDPDQSIYAFRGTATGAVEDFPDRFRTSAGRPAATLALSVCRRSGPVLLAATRRVAAPLGGPAAHRRLVPGPGLAPGSVAVRRLASPAAETTAIAGWLRAAHVRDGRPWSAMAVLTRTREGAAALRRGLAQAGVPVHAVGQEVPIAEQPAAAALLDVLTLVLDPAAARPELVERLLAGPLGTVDAVARRRLRAAATAIGAAPAGSDGRAGSGDGAASPVPGRGPGNPGGAGTVGAGPVGADADGAHRHGVASLPLPRTGGAVLAAAFGDPGGADAVALATASPAVGRLLAGVDAGRRAVAAVADARAALWAVWEGLGLAGPWRHAALVGGPRGALADRDLDSVVALFGQFDDLRSELPGLALDAVVEEVTERSVPPARAGATVTAAVSVLTVHASKGLEWPLVAVAGVQEQTWPDLRRRGSLLGVRELVRAVDDPVAADLAPAAAAAADRAQSLAEERRLLYVALTRAGAALLVTAVEDTGHQPSRFLDDLDGEGRGGRAAADRTDPARTAAATVAARSVGAEVHSGDGGPVAGSVGSVAVSAEAVSGTDPGRTSGPVDPGSVDPGSGEPGGEGAELPFLDVRALVARLRREVCDPAGHRREAAAGLLARLAGAGVAGADPDGWWGLPALSGEVGPTGPPAGTAVDPGTAAGAPIPAVAGVTAVGPDPARPGGGAAGPPPRLTPSALENLATCPLRWFLTSTGARGAAGPKQTVGTLLHALAEEVATGRTAVEDLLDRFRDRSATLLAGDGWPQRRERQRFEAMVERLQSWLTAHAGGDVRAEVRFEAELPTAAGPVRLAGTIDRLEVSDGGRVSVVDFKTGKKVTAREVEEHLQLGVYQLAVTAGAAGFPAGTAVDRAVLVQVAADPLSTPAQATVDPAAPPEWLASALDDAGRVLRGGVFEARPGAWCRSCDVRHCCPAKPEGEQVTG